MFRVNIGRDRVVLFTFKHEHFDEPIRFEGASWVKAQSQCSIGFEGAYPVYAWAYCSIKDTFDKDKARKLSLTRAMKILGLDKDERSLVWERYFMRNVPNAVYKDWEDAFGDDADGTGWDLRESVGNADQYPINESVGRASTESIREIGPDDFGGDEFLKEVD